MASDSLMDCAGRDPSHPFGDLRSAAYAARRNKKTYRAKLLHKKSYSCNWCRPQNILNRLFRKLEAKCDAQDYSWEGQWEEEARFEHDLSWMDDLTRYRVFGKHREIFETESFDEYGYANTYSGEDFGAWCRRRINEMRAVKEGRLERKLAGIDEDTYNKSHITATTLPTNQEDIETHELIHKVITPSNRTRNFLRSKSKPEYLQIHGFRWFGEYEWQWHRNASGCWELGYAAECATGFSYPCYCGWIIRCDHDLDGCSCPNFLSWQKSPEDMQECSLVEWVSGKLREIMMQDQKEFEQMLQKI